MSNIYVIMYNNNEDHKVYAVEAYTDKEQAIERSRILNKTYSFNCILNKNNDAILHDDETGIYYTVDSIILHDKEIQ